MVWVDEGDFGNAIVINLLSHVPKYQHIHGGHFICLKENVQYTKDLEQVDNVYFQD